MAEGAILLTGATGFVGMELLARYLERGERSIILPIRAQDDAAAAERLGTLLGGVFGADAGRHAGRVEAVAADLTKPGLGLVQRQRERIAERTCRIVHAAASVSFALPLNESRRVNVAGTQRMLALGDLARELGGLERFDYVSTAYVAGTHAGPFHEHDFDVGQDFRNAYERSKLEAEYLVRSRDLPTTILRPSIVVGDRHSGWTAAFNVLYWPLRAFARGLFEAVPAVPSAPVDVVSVDYVADAIHALTGDPATVGGTYHLAAGAHASSVAELTELARRHFDRPPPRVLPPDEFTRLPTAMDGRQRSVGEQSSIYFPYFAIETTFDDTRARARLEPAGIRVSPLRDYLERLLDFATRTVWGKRPMSRADALAAADAFLA